MYLPRAFACSDRARILAIAAEHPFAMVVGDGLEISHLPCLLEGEPLLVRTHVARGNPLARLAAAGSPMTAVFSGPHAYVSSRWYETPSQQVPTWNYVVVQATGRARAMSDADTRQLLRDLSLRFEGPDGWTPDWLEGELFAQIAAGVVGIEIEVERLEGKEKLSQNRSRVDRDRVSSELSRASDPGARATAEAMRRR